MPGRLHTLKISDSIAPDGVATTAALHDAGVSRSMITNRCRSNGPWRRLLPGVIMLGKEPPTRRQLLRAAVAYAGGDVVVTGADALWARGLDVALPRTVHLLVPTGRRVAAKGFLAVERTSRSPAPWLDDGVPFAPPVRAAVDVARSTSDPVALRSALALTMLHELGTRAELEAELEAGNQRGTADVRCELRASDGLVATVLHAHAERLLRAAPLPPPRWNVTVLDRRTRPIGYADAWWDELALAWQLAANDQPGLPAHGRLSLTAAGVVVVRTPVRTVLSAARHSMVRDAVVTELTKAFRAAMRRRRPPIQARWFAMPDVA